VAGLRALPQRLAFWSMANEKQLEDRIEADPSVLGEPVIILGRQVPTAGSLTWLVVAQPRASPGSPKGAVLVVVGGNGFGECCDSPASSLNALDESDLLENTLSITNAVG
jgi:hypothetical protein